MTLSSDTDSGSENIGHTDSVFISHKLTSSTSTSISIQDSVHSHPQGHFEAHTSKNNKKPTFSYHDIFNLGLGLAVCLSVCRSSKNYKTVQTFTKLYKTLRNKNMRSPSHVKTVKEASAL